VRNEIFYEIKKKHNKIFIHCIMLFKQGKMKMFISNGNLSPQQQKVLQTASIDNLRRKSTSTPSALNAPIISRIHNVRPGCGACGR
jgi:hypothetical protein